MEMTEEQKIDFQNRAGEFLKGCAELSKQYGLDLVPVIEYGETGIKPTIKIVATKKQEAELVSEVPESAAVAEGADMPPLSEATPLESVE